jgi:uncharacterized protein with PIN domain
LASSFLDTSALAKLYHEEPGSEYVERIINQPGSKVILSRLSLIEMESVSAMKSKPAPLMRMGGPSRCRRLRADIARNRLIVGPPIDKRLCEVAEACGCPAIDPAQPGLVQG